MRPDFEITVNGRPLAVRASSVELQDNSGDESDVLVIVLPDAGRLRIPPRGAEIALRMGYVETGLVDKGVFFADEIEATIPPKTLTITARATVMLTDAPIKAPRQRSWHDTTIGAIVEQVAAENGLAPTVSPGLAGISVKHIDQTSSDLQLLADLAHKNGAISKTAAGRLLFVTKADGRSASGTEVPPVPIQPGDGVTGRWQAADRSHYTGVRTHWHDVAAGEQKATLAGTADSVLDVPRTYASQAEAESAGQALLADLLRGVGSLTIKMPGKPELYAGRRIRLAGFRAGIDGDWTISRCVHRIGGAYTTDITATTASEDEEP